MSLIDKVVAAVTPMESDEERKQARQTALAIAGSGKNWLSMVLEHHSSIEGAFATVKSATTETAQAAAQKKLATLLTGHSMAEEAVLYPALVNADEKAHATKAYTEQSAAKMQMGLLETIPPMTQEFIDKLEHIRGAVLHHMYEEENTWFRELKEQATSAEEARLTARYEEEFTRYMGSTMQVQGVRSA